MCSSRKSWGYTGACFEYVNALASMKVYSNNSKEVEDDEKSEGFWRELFLLKPDLVKLRELLEDTDAEFLIHIQVSV